MSDQDEQKPRAYKRPRPRRRRTATFRAMEAAAATSDSSSLASSSSSSAATPHQASAAPKPTGRRPKRQRIEKQVGEETQDRDVRRDIIRGPEHYLIRGSIAHRVMERTASLEGRIIHDNPFPDSPTRHVRSVQSHAATIDREHVRLPIRAWPKPGPRARSIGQEDVAVWTHVEDRDDQWPAVASQHELQKDSDEQEDDDEDVLIEPFRVRILEGSFPGTEGEPCVLAYYFCRSRLTFFLSNPRYGSASHVARAPRRLPREWSLLYSRCQTSGKDRGTQSQATTAFETRGRRLSDGKAIPGLSEDNVSWTAPVVPRGSLLEISHDANFSDGQVPASNGTLYHEYVDSNGHGKPPLRDATNGTSGSFKVPNEDAALDGQAYAYYLAVQEFRSKEE